MTRLPEGWRIMPRAQRQPTTLYFARASPLHQQRKRARHSMSDFVVTLGEAIENIAMWASVMSSRWQEIARGFAQEMQAIARAMTVSWPETQFDIYEWQARAACARTIEDEYQRAVERHLAFRARYEPPFADVWLGDDRAPLRGVRSVNLQIRADARQLERAFDRYERESERYKRESTYE